MKRLLKLVLGLLTIAPLAFAVESEQITDASFRPAVPISYRPLLTYASSTGGVHLLPNIIVIKPTGLAGGGGGGGGGVSSGGSASGCANNTVVFVGNTGTIGCSAASLVYTDSTSTFSVNGAAASSILAFSNSPVISRNNSTGVVTISTVSNNFDILLSPNAVQLLDLNNNTGFGYLRTMTTAGTTGAQTINKPAGSVNFAAAATTLVVTDSFALTTSGILVTPQAADTTCKSFAVTRAAGSFTLTANAACTAETAVYFQVNN